MHIFEKGRPAFLEFLRNLTPQILLLSFALVAYSRIDIGRWDPSNWGPTLVFYSFAIAWLLALVASAIQFTEAFCTSFEPLNVRAIKAERRVNSLKNRSVLLVRSAIRLRWQLIPQVLVAFFVMQILLAVAVASGILAAVNALKLTG